MLLPDLQQQIHPLSKGEKVQLLHFLVDELAQPDADAIMWQLHSAHRTPAY